MLVFFVPCIYYRQLTDPAHPHAAPCAVNATRYSSLNSTPSAHPNDHNMAQPYSAAATVTLHGYHGGARSVLYTPGPPSFSMSPQVGYPAYDSGVLQYDANSEERGEFV
jgi:hypothetical protein